MPKDLNSVTVSGTLADDIDLRYTSGNNTAVANIRIEVETWYQASGEWKSRTSYFTATAWGQRAERIANRLQQGDRLWISGELTTNSWEDKSGERQYRTEIRVDDFGPISGGQNEPQAQADPQPQPADQRRPQQNQRGGQQQRGGSNGPPVNNQQQNTQQGEQTFEPDDELPF
jgi:single-strand DNA-binding protein